MKPLVRRATALLALTSLLVSGWSTGPLTGHDAWEAGTASDAAAAPPAATLERRWEGGGAAILFADDMSPYTALHYEAMDPYDDGRPFDYYGGAVPAPGGDKTWQWTPDRWRHEAYRWGQEGAQSTIEGTHAFAAWEHGAVGDGAWRFGRSGGATAAYPAGVLSGLVSPVVDLRSVESPTSDTNRSADHGSVQVYDQVFERILPGNQNLTVPNPVPQNIWGSHVQVGADTQQSAAALRVRHAYDFLVQQGVPRDGGRVEVSAHDPLQGWTPWHGLEPTTQTLRVGSDDLSGRTAQPGLRAGGNVSAQADEPGAPDAEDPQPPEAELNASAWGGTDAVVLPDGTSQDPLSFAQATADLTASARDGVSPGVALATPTPTWMYAGVVQSSTNDRLHGPWRGFSGASGGHVESVFDLTDYAGHLIRLRFLASTQQTPTDEPELAGLAGWRVDQLEVHAATESGIQVLDLASPGDGAVVDNATDFHPVVALQNTDSDPARAAVRVELEGHGLATDEARLGAGPLGRVLHASSRSFHDLLGGAEAGGLHHLRATAVTKAGDANAQPPAGLEDGDATDAEAATGESTRRFHFQAGGGTEWRVVDVRFEPLLDEGEDFDLASDRLTLRNKPALVVATIENLSPENQALDLTQDVTPVLRSLGGVPVGAFLPEAGPDTVDLPPSREISGALGRPDAAQEVAWRWSGTSQAQPLDLFIEDGAGQVRFDAGRVRVEAMEPDAMNVDLSNRWDYDGDCKRVQDFLGERGVVRCTGVGTADSPVVAFDGRFLLLGGRSATLNATHQGDSLDVKLWTHDQSLLDDSGQPTQPPARSDPGWVEAGSATLPGTAGWRMDEDSLHEFPENWEGWIFLRIVGQADDETAVDEIRLDVGNQRIPVLWETLDVTLRPEGSTIRSSVGHDLTWLYGRDGWAEEDGPSQSGRVTIDRGDVHISEDFSSFVDGVGVSWKLASGRLLEDSILQMPDPIDLHGARPTLHFNHWIDAGAYATAVVEVAPADGESPEQVVEDAAGWSPSAADAVDADAWEPVAVFRGQSIDSELVPVSVPLWEYAGQSVLVRFRYHLDAPTDLTRIPAGWLVDDVRVEFIGPQGETEVHSSRGFAAYDAGGGVEIVSELNVPRINPATVEEDHILLEIDAEEPTQCASRNGIRNTYPYTPAAITDRVNLVAADAPILTLEHQPKFQRAFPSGSTGGPYAQAVIDLEYQVLGPDGRWPASWTRATPHLLWQQQPEGGWTWPGQYPSPEPPGVLRDPNGNRVEPPFTSPEWLPADEEDRTVTRFDLSPLAGEEARFRLHIWTENEYTNDRNRCKNPNPVWNIYSMTIREEKHLTDGALVDILVDPDDADLIDRLDADAIASRTDEAVVARDNAFVILNVTNDGKLPIRLNASLSASMLNSLVAPAIDVSFVDDFTNPDLPTALSQPWGHLPTLHADEWLHVRFLVDFSKEAPPGRYVLQAGVSPVDALDTDPTDDRGSRGLFVQPVRALSADRAGAGVEPFAAPADEDRFVRTTIRNEGNVLENHVRAEARLIHLTGLTEGVPVDGITLESKEVKDFFPRSGTANLQWKIAGDGPAADLLEPGQRYAVEVRLRPADDSVLEWWHDTPQPMHEVDEGVLLNLTDLGTRCECIFLPFIVEERIVGTDFSAQNTTSLLPGTLTPTLLADGWEPSTRARVGSEWVDADDRDDLPHWQRVPAAAAGDVEGEEPEGAVWRLPGYVGLEDVEQELRSPPLPAHVVAGQSRALLGMRYASTASDDQVVLESRSLRGGEWSHWQPLNGERQQRVAVVLAPDFPRVTGHAFGYGENTPSNLEQVKGHPAPPYYDAAGGSVGCTDPVDGERCKWSPFPAFRPGGDPEWVAALASALSRLADQVGEDNVATFSTLEETNLFLPTQDWPQNGQHPLVELGLNLSADGRFLNVWTENADLARHTARIPDAFDCPEPHCGSDRTMPVHRIPLRPMLDLGARLDTYGAIVLMGDNATTTYADQSRSLREMSFVPDDAEPGQTTSTPLGHVDPIAVEHHQDLFEILRAADGAGVRVLGAMGPATGALALSGVAEGAQFTMWTTPGIPEERPVGPLRGTGSCVSDAYDPKQACQTTEGFGDNRRQISDPDNPLNYQYTSSADAQTAALHEFILGQGVNLVPFVSGINPQCPFHELNPVGPPQMMMRMCGTFQPDLLTSHHPTSGIAFVTASGTPRTQTEANGLQNHLASEAQEWVDEVLRQMHGEANLPASGGRWQLLDTSLGAPVGGRFLHNETGATRFDGDAMQLRLRVRSDPAAGGHGGLAVDRVDLLGAPRENDLGVRFVQPVDGESRTPGEAFHAAVEVTNRGLNATDPTTVEVRVEQRDGWDCPDTNGDPRCRAPEQNPITLLVDGLAAGKSRIIPVGGSILEGEDALLTEYAEGQGGAFFHGRFPSANDLAPAEHNSAFDFTAFLDPPADDEEELDDVAHAAVFGRERVFPLVKSPNDVRISPNQADRAAADAVGLEIDLTHDGTSRTQVAIVNYRVAHARAPHCNYDQNGGAFDVYAHCDPHDTAEPLPDPVWQSNNPIVVSVPRATTLPWSQPIDLEDAGLEPGVYRVSVSVDTQDSMGEPLPQQSFTRWLHLHGANVSPDRGWAADGSHASLVAHDTSQLADNDLNDPFQAWQTRGTSPAFTPNAPCGPDPGTQAGDFGSGGALLVHGWRVSDDAQDACSAFHDPHNTALEWRRSFAPSTPQDAASWSANENICGSSCTVPSRGLADFGPDAVTWNPHAGNETFFPHNHNQNTPIQAAGVPLSLAGFERPVLTLDSRFQAGPLTGYVVEMSVPIIQCQGAGSPNPILNCNWNWNWGSDQQMWFPLVDADGETTNPYNTPDRTPRQFTPGNPNSPGSQPTWSRIPSNPLAGLPGIWEATSQGPHAGDDWQVLRYPIDPDVQTHNVPGPEHMGLEGSGGYCGTVGNTERSARQTGVLYPGIPLSEYDFNTCRYVVDGDGQTIPRPVQFRLRAASGGTETGVVNFWQVRSLDLTEHAVQVEGATSLEIGMRDNETRLVPLRFHNAGSVDDLVRFSRHNLDDPHAIRSDLQLHNDVRVGLSTSPLDEPVKTLDLAMPPGSSRIVWLHVDVGFQTGAFPGIPNELPVVVEARSLRDPLATASALVTTTYTAREWGDLTVARFLLDDREEGQLRASVGVPATATLEIHNKGFKSVGGPDQPIPVRLVAHRLDETGERVHTAVVNSTHVTEVLQNCGTCQAFSTLEWTPDVQGVYDLVGEVNRPPLVPENRPDNNDATQRVVVGDVPLPDLQVRDAWLVPFHPERGCHDPEARAERAIVGHSYCVVAQVTNVGTVAALEPQVDFRVGASDPFSRRHGGTDGVLPDPFPAGHTEQVVSGKWDAVERADGGLDWTFFADVSSRNIMPVGNKTLDFPVHVDRFSLEAPGPLQSLPLHAGDHVRTTVLVANRGTAPATPVAAVGGDREDLRVHVVQPPPLRPGEQEEVEVVIAVSRSLQNGTSLPAVVLSTLEDPLVRAPLPLELDLRVGHVPRATVLPTTAAPGNATLDVVVDNTGSGEPLRLRILGAQAPLHAEAGNITLPAHGLDVFPHAVRVEPHTPPGIHAASLRLEAQYGGARVVFDASTNVTVPVAAGIASHVPERVTAARGLPARLPVDLENTGNVPVELAVAHRVDAGRVDADGDIVVLQPAQTVRLDPGVHAGPADRALGETHVQWRVVGQEAWMREPVRTWSATFTQSAVSIGETDLADLRVRPGTNHVRLTLHNPLDRAADAEVLVAVDDRLQSRAARTVEPGVPTSLELPFTATDGASHTITLLARPAGTNLTLDDPVLYDVGDARTRTARVDDADAWWDVEAPAPGWLLSLALLAAAVLAARRRRGDQ